MDDKTLLGVIGQFEQESYGFAAGELQSQRSYAIDRYLGQPFGDEVEGRSQVVSTDLRDVIEWILPQCLRVFLGGDEVVKFTPTGPEDEDQARLETQYVNWIILERNDSFNMFSTWFRDALISKVGYVKAYWQTRTDIKLEAYQGLTQDEYDVLTGDKSVEIVEESSYPDPYLAQQQPAPAAQAMSMGQGPNSQPPVTMLYDCKVRRVLPCGHVKIANVPPEEIAVHHSHRDVSLEDCVFLRHRVRKTASVLRQEGFEIPDDIAADTGNDTRSPNESIELSRDRFSDTNQELTTVDEASLDPANRFLWVDECYIRVDYDGDGVAELRKVCKIGNVILNYKDGEPCNEETDIIPFAAITPIVFPHRHIGMGYDDLTRQTGEAKTAIMRQFLDNLYLANNGRHVVDVNTINIDDFLVSRPGGIVRSNGNPSMGVMPLTHPVVGQAALEGMQWIDSWRENATGVSAYYQGLNADALNKTATGISQIMSASQGRVEAVTRSFAAGVKDLFNIVHALTLKNATNYEKVKLNNEWATVDPREWVKRTNMVITVGLGTGSRESRIAQLMQLLQIQMQGLQIGVAQPQNIYATGTRISEEMGYRNTQEFWTDPSKQPPAPPQPHPMVQAEQIKAQANMQIAQVKQQADQAAQQARMQADMSVQQHKIQTDAQLKLAETQMQLKLDAIRHSMEQQTEIEIAKIKAAAQVQAADITATKQAANSMYEQEMNGQPVSGA